MSWLSKSETENMKHARWAREKEETHALLEQLASELVPAAEAEQAERLAKFEEEYKADCAGYSFDCTRHGNFLTLQVTRNANPTTPDPYSFSSSVPERQMATTINLAQSREIKLISGHVPDRNGELEFYYQCARIDGTGSAVGGTGFGNYAAPSGYRWKVLAPSEFYYLSPPHGRPLVVLDPVPEKNCQTRYAGSIDLSADNYSIKTRVKNAARVAQDDRIRFEGAGATLFCPAGMGEEAQAKILKALE